MALKSAHSIGPAELNDAIKSAVRSRQASNSRDRFPIWFGLLFA